jgi:Ca-activated chloride channel family protein
MMTELTPRAERQLKGVAEDADGKYVRAEKGSTGILEVAKVLQAQMRTELDERDEEVWADVFMWPLMAAVLLLIIDAFLTDAPLRRFLRKQPPAQAMLPGLKMLLSRPGGMAPVPGGSGPGAHGPNPMPPPPRPAFEIDPAASPGAAAGASSPRAQTGEGGARA